jgi:hypothetical protein
MLGEAKHDAEGLKTLKPTVTNQLPMTRARTVTHSVDYRLSLGDSTRERIFCQSNTLNQTITVSDLNAT